MTEISKRKGFTLIEILIAIFILAIVLSTVYASYTGTFRIVRDTEYGDDIYSMARSTMEKMITDLEAVCKYSDSFRFISFRNEFFQREFMNLSFLSSAHLNLDDENLSGIADISYDVEEDSEKDGYIIVRRDELNKNREEEPEKRGKGYILCDRLQSLTYKFYDSKGQEYDMWDSGSDAQKDKAPSVVAVYLDFINPDKEDSPYKFMTKIFLPVAEN